jgi:NADPH:quinone reductase
LRAVQVAQFGVEHVRLAEAADPVPGAGEVLIRTEAATINPADLGIVTGAAVPRFPPGTAAPYTPGWDLVGLGNTIRVVTCFSMAAQVCKAAT